MTHNVATCVAEQKTLMADMGTNQSAHISPIFTLDHAGGASLVNSDAYSVTLNQTGLVSLDLIGSNTLQTLVFASQAPTQRHLQVRKCPHLTCIQGPLAQDGHGAVVHLDRAVSDNNMQGSGLHSGLNHELQINMPVARIDAAWQDSQGHTCTFAFSCDASIKPPQHKSTTGTKRYWERVSILSAMTLSQHPELLVNASKDDFIIIDFDDYAAPSGAPSAEHSNTLSLTTQAELACLNLSGIKALQVTGAAALHVLGADSQLTAMSTDSPNIYLERIPELEQVQPLPSDLTSDAASHTKAQLLALTECNADALHIQIPTELVKLKHSTTSSLTIDSCDTLNIHSCPLIKRLSCEPLPMIELSGAVSNSLLEHARLSMNERIVRHNMADIESADDPKLLPLLNMVPMQLNGRDIYPALLVLQKALNLGVPIEQVWTLRNQLNTNHLEHYKAGSNRSKAKPPAQHRQDGDTPWQQPSHKHPTNWAWRLRGDGSSEAWRIDFILWIHALNANVEHAKRMRKLVGQRIGEHDLARQAAAHVLLTHAELLTTARWYGLIKQAYKVHSKHAYGRCLLQHSSDSQKRFVHALLSFTKRLPPSDDDLKRLAVDFVVQCYSIDTAEALASKLFEVHAPHMRARCLEKSRQPEHLPTHFLDNKPPRHTRYLKLALASR